MRQIIKETIANVTLPSEQFTQQLKKLEKECGGKYYLNLQDDERLAMYNIIESTIEDTAYNNETQYNIFRLAKYVVWVKHKIKQSFKTYLKRYLRTVLHPYGNIRVAGRKLVDRIRFGIYDLTSFDEFSKNTKKEAEEKKMIYPLVADVFMNLQRMETNYQKEHITTIDPKDLYMREDFIYPEDTKDKILKSLRKGMEARDAGYMDKIMEYCGYLPLYESDKPWFCGGRYLPKKMVNSHFIGKDKIKDKASDEFIKAKIQQKRKETEKALEVFLSSSKFNFGVEYIKDIIYNSDQNLMVENGIKRYMHFWMDILDEHDIDFSQNLLDLLSACRNYFPHKSLDGKCPEEKINGL